jgi:hypothetical protein
MAENDDIFKKNVKNSFFRVKEDINGLKKAIERIESLLSEKEEETHDFIDEEEEKGDIMADEPSDDPRINEEDPPVSSGKALSNHKAITKQSLSNHTAITQQSLSNHTAITKQSLSNHTAITQQSQNKQSKRTLLQKEELEKIFKELPKSEFLIFLTIAQLEEEGVRPTYTSLAHKLERAQSNIRGHISSLLKKSLPIIKGKANNKIIVFKISPHFREWNWEERLQKWYYQLDPHQTKKL